jgi:CPA2 family monovalent cation:H+ antiporter-2
MAVALFFVFYICNSLWKFSSALLLTIGLVIIVLIVYSRSVKNRSILLERLFRQNLNAHEIEAQVHGKKRPLFERHLLDRNIHIADVEVPVGSLWAGQTLGTLNLGRRYGIHVSSILRAGHRLNIPDGNMPIFPTDRLQVIGTDDQLNQLHQALEKEVMADDPDVEQREMRLQSISLRQGHPFIGHTMKEAGIREQYGCMVVGLEEGREQLSQVSPQYRFKQDDIIWMVGEKDSLGKLTIKE